VKKREDDKNRGRDEMRKNALRVGNLENICMTTGQEVKMPFVSTSGIEKKRRGSPPMSTWETFNMVCSQTG